MFQEFLNKIVKINLRNGSFLKGELIEIEEQFLKIKTLSQVRFVSVVDIMDIRVEQNSDFEAAKINDNRTIKF